MHSVERQMQKAVDLAHAVGLGRDAVDAAIGDERLRVRSLPDPFSWERVHRGVLMRAGCVVDVSQLAWW